MNKKLFSIIICILFFLSAIGTISSATEQKKSMDYEPLNSDYSHGIFAEFFTMTTCVPCKYAHQALYQLYYEKWHYPYFYYITYVYNKNNNSMHRRTELQVIGSPTTAFDGGYRNIVGAEEIEKEKTRFNNTILLCAARNVNDIDLTLNVEWLGAVNNYPVDGATKVPIEAVLNWTVTEMKIDVEAKNNEASEYDGHIHLQVTECNSTYWDDKFGYPYTFEFKDYALNQDMLLNAGATFSKTIYWDGMDYTDKGGDGWNPHKFDYLTQDNTMVIASVFDKDNKYVDETAGFLAGVDTDPKTFDVYFGTTNPPPQIIMNTTVKKYDPPGNLNWTTDYYWKVDVWNALGEKTPGKVLSFTTRGNAPPYKPMDIYPKNRSTNIPINTDLKWSGGDPDGDDVTYDIYFGEFDPFENPPKVEQKYDGTSYKPKMGNLDFNTKYAWKIVSWDEYGLYTYGEKWNFITQENIAPYPAKDPRPPNGAQNVPGNAILRWNGSDPNPGDILRYDVYFGPNPNPPLVKSKISDNVFDPYGTGEMPIFEDFYWKIDTYDSGNLMTPGNEWKFTTGINPPPTDPEIDGPTRGNPEVVYDFIFVSFDQDNQTIRYVIDWDDGNITETDLYDNGTAVTLNHSWAKKGTYLIKATAIDEYGEESEKSQHKILIPRNRAVDYKNIILGWLFERFPRMFQLLRYLFGL